MRKRKICKRLFELLKETKEYADLQSIHYDMERELVTIGFEDSTYDVNVAGDSEADLIYNILSELMLI